MHSVFAMGLLMPQFSSANGVRTTTATDAQMEVQNQLNQVPQIQINKNHAYENARKGEAGSKMASQYTKIMSNVMKIGGTAAVTAGTIPCPSPKGCNYALIAKGRAMIALSQLFNKDSQSFGKSAVDMSNLQYDLGGAGNATNGGLYGGPLDKELRASEERARQAQADLKKLGFEVLGDGSIKDPDGKIISPDTASNPSALGIDSNAMAQAQAEASRQSALLDASLGPKLQEAMAALNSGEVGEQYGDMSNGFEAGGGATKGGGLDLSSGSNIYESLQALKEKKANDDRKVASELKGLAQRYGDSLIGVEADNIFMMIHRFYDVNRHEYPDN